MQSSDKILPLKTYKFIFDSSLSFAVKADFKSDLNEALGTFAYFLKAERTLFGINGIEVIFTPNTSNGTVFTWSESIRKILEKNVYGDLYLSESELYAGSTIEQITDNIKSAGINLSEGLKTTGNYIVIIAVITLIIYIGMRKK